MLRYSSGPFINSYDKHYAIAKIVRISSTDINNGNRLCRVIRRVNYVRVFVGAKRLKCLLSGYRSKNRHIVEWAFLVSFVRKQWVRMRPNCIQQLYLCFPLLGLEAMCRCKLSGYQNLAV